MFEQLFRYPGVVERYRATPLARDRLRYLVHLAGAGAHPTTLRALASRQLALVRLLDVREDRPVRREQLEDVDWEAETLRVRLPKPGRTHLYPFSRPVGRGQPTLVAPGHRRPEAGAARATACLRPAPSGPRPVDEGRRGPPRTSQSGLDGRVRPGSPSRVARGGGLRAGGIGMTLQAAIEQYVAWRQARGTRFQSGVSVLRLYGRSVVSDVECDAVRPDQASTFLAGADSLAACPRTNRRNPRQANPRSRNHTHAGEWNAEVDVASSRRKDRQREQTLVRWR